MGINMARTAIGTTIAAVSLPGLMPGDAAAVCVGVAELVTEIVIGVGVGTIVDLDIGVEDDNGAVSVIKPGTELALGAPPTV